NKRHFFDRHLIPATTQHNHHQQQPSPFYEQWKLLHFFKSPLNAAIPHNKIGKKKKTGANRSPSHFVILKMEKVGLSGMSPRNNMSVAKEGIIYSKCFILNSWLNKKMFK